MAAELALELYGIRARITAVPEPLLESVRRTLAGPWKQVGPEDGAAALVKQAASGDVRVSISSLGDGTYLVTRDEGELMTAPLQRALDFLESHLRHEVATRSPDKIIVHAGVVGIEDQAVVIPGETRSGKTTLVAALVRAGAAYLSDEYAVIDEGGLVHPFAKPLSIRDDESVSHDYPVERLGGQIAAGPLPVALIVFSRYHAGAAWHPRPLSDGDAMLALLHHTAQTRDRPASTLAALKRAIEPAIVLEGERGEAEEVVPSLLDALVS